MARILINLPIWTMLAVCTYEVEDEDLLKEIEENEKRADKEEARATATPKK
jgi:hypothetical protein